MQKGEEEERGPAEASDEKLLRAGAAQAQCEIGPSSRRG